MLVSVVNGRRWNVRSSDGSVGVVKSGEDFDLSVSVDLGPIDARLDALEASVAGLETDVGTLAANIGTVQGNLSDLQSAFDTFAGPPVIIDVDTNDDAPVTVTMATLASPGDAVFYYVNLRAESDDGTEGFRYTAWMDASRNAVGPGGIRTGNIGPTGHTNTVDAPWSSSVAVPVGWGGVTNEIDVSGDDVIMQFAGALATNIRWRGVVQRILIGGAT